MSERRGTMPRDVNGRRPLFDQFAEMASQFVSKGLFFACCVTLVVIWAPSFLVLPDLNTYQLLINTATTIVTFLLVALIQNTAQRADQAVQHKLNAIAAGLCELMERAAVTDPELRGHCEELRAAVGLEQREST